MIDTIVGEVVCGALLDLKSPAAEESHCFATLFLIFCWIVSDSHC